MNRLFSVLFPSEPRGFPFRRWIKDLFRASHILTAGVLLGGHVFQQPPELIHPWGVAAVLTGLGIFLIDLHASFAVLFEFRGLAILTKIALVYGALQWPEHAWLLLGLTMFIGAMSSHMTGKWRHRVYLMQERLTPDTRRG